MQNVDNSLRVAEVVSSYGQNSQAQNTLKDGIRKEQVGTAFQGNVIEIKSGKNKGSRTNLTRTELAAIATCLAGLILALWGTIEAQNILNLTPLLGIAFLVGIVVAGLVDIAVIRFMTKTNDQANEIAVVFIFSVGMVAGIVGAALVSNNVFLRSAPVQVSFPVTEKSSGASKLGLNYYLTIDDGGRSELIQLQELQWNKYAAGDRFETNVGTGLWGYRVLPAPGDR